MIPAVCLPLLVLATSVPQPPPAIDVAAPQTSLRVVASGATMDTFFDGVSDPDYTGGLEGDILFAPGPHLRLGVGLRYELAQVPAIYSFASATDRFLTVPFLIGAAIPLRGRHEVELLGGIGLGAGWIRGTTIDGSPFLHTVGITTELAITYWMPITRALDLSLGAALTFAALHMENGEDGTVLRGTIPLRIGARWSL